ncbi:hypothetical protein [Methanospirillum lacunae]|uniref:Flagellin n=1 Tax=Methanospirillum lacunae TaxID=668570 RepID=A0A2V2MXC9_9EURY|nr:hypothetical protein [Methanospirillum lacunae]PWR72794.1 hypothetical protein DK846_07540 [Methanospirillum lacunae]
MVSSLVTGAVALVLILTGGYVIAAGILTIAESTMNSQIEMGNIQDGIRQSLFRIDSTTKGPDGSDYWLVVDLNNTGSITYTPSDVARTDLYVYDKGSNTLRRYTSNTLVTPHFSYVIPNDLMNKDMWDPSETLEIRINGSINPDWTKISTPNGITASTNL